MEKVFSPSRQQVFIIGHHSDLPGDVLPMTVAEELEYVGRCPPDMMVLPLPGGGWRHSPRPAPVVSLEERRQVVEAARRIAYADPISGSDRYFSEAQREALLGNAAAADAAKALGMARFAEIQELYPWPTE